MKKTCRRCNTVKDLSEFYLRPRAEGTKPGHYLTECKSCMKERSRVRGYVKDSVSYVPGEIMAIDYLTQKGIPALPGKAIAATHVDVVAYGCVWIEVKHARPKYLYTQKKEFVFVSTPSQIHGGYRAHVVLLICEHEPNERTFHFFRASDPVFYMEDGRIKNSFNFVVGRDVPLKHAENRVVMVTSMMEAAQDNIDLIYETLHTIENQLRES